MKKNILILAALIAVFVGVIYAFDNNLTLPEPPTMYAGSVDLPTTLTLSWANGAGAVTVRHELSTDGGITWSRLDDDVIPANTSDHSLPTNCVCYLRAKSMNGSGSSSYTPEIVVVTGNYDPE